jgi:cytochrome c-type biogenesis protein CcmH/NrfG
MSSGKKTPSTPAAPSAAATGMVKRETLWLVVLAALAVGFVGGVVFSAWRMERVPGSMPPRPMGGAAPAPQDFSAEIDRLRQKTDADPKDTAAWTELGNRYFDSDRPQEAITAYEKSLALDPSNADVWTDLGVMYRRVGEHRKAIEVFDKAKALNPRHEVSRFNKGIVLLHDLNDQNAALEAWEDLLRINPLATTPNGQSLDAMVRAIRQQNSAAAPGGKGGAAAQGQAK